MPPTIQEQIDALQEQINIKRGDGSGEPAPCSIAGLNATINDLEAQIKVLRAGQIGETNPFAGTTMILRLDGKNMSSLVGANQAAVALINAIGVKPAAVTMGDVTVSVSGNSIVVSATGETDIFAALGKLIAFANDKEVVIDVTQIQTVKAGNIDKAEQYLSSAQLQEDILVTMMTDGATLAPLKPDIGLPYIVVDNTNKSVVVDVTTTGSTPITIDITWGDGDTDSNVTYPIDHTYTEEGEYTITMTATNSAGTDTKTILIKIGN